MRSGHRSPITPSMAVALTALAVALGGSAFAASGAFEDADGTVQACVTQSNIVRDVTDVVDEGTAQTLAPATRVITRKGTVLAVKPGEKCPQGSTPQSLATPTTVFTARGNPTRLGATKRPTVELMGPGGDYLVDATVKIAARGESTVIHTIKCVLTGPDGKTIAGTESSATIPAGSPNERLTIPVSAALTDMPEGTIALACKDSAPAETSASSARAAATPSPEQHDARSDRQDRTAGREARAVSGHVQFGIAAKGTTHVYVRLRSS